MTDPLTCIHALAGLCEACQDDYEEDPSAWLEFGLHPEGIANGAALEAEMAAYHASAEGQAEHRAAMGQPGEDIPF